MEYSLTEADIAKLESLNFYPDPNSKPMPGEIATFAEMQSLGIDTSLVTPTKPKIDTDSILPPIKEEINVTPRVNDISQTNMGSMQQLLQLIKQQQEAAAKPTTYTPDQKRLLAYAGIADAGRALQGKEGTAVASLMTNFTDMADQKRKADAALAQRNMIGSIMGGMGNAATLNDPDQIRAAIADLTNILAVSPSMEPFIKLQVENLYKRLDDIETLEESASSAETSLDLIDALLEQDLSQVSGVKGFFNSIFAEYGLAPKYTNINSLVEQLDGLNFLEIFVKLKGGGQITENETKQGKAAQSRIRAVIEGRGSEADLRAAVKEVQLYFDDAIKKNPTYKEAKKDAEDLRKKWLNPPENG